VGVAAGSAAAAPAPSRAEAATTDEVATTGRRSTRRDGHRSVRTAPCRCFDRSRHPFGVDQVRLDAGMDRRKTSRIKVALLSALTQVGVPYRRNMSKVGIGFDCSGLTAYAWARRASTSPTTARRNFATPQPARSPRPRQATWCTSPATSCCGSVSTATSYYAPRRGHPVELWQISDRSMRRTQVR